LNLNQASSRSGSSPEQFCAWADSIAVRIRKLAENQLHWLETGRNPATVRGSETGAQAQPETGHAKIARMIFPPVDGGLLLRA